MAEQTRPAPHSAASASPGRGSGLWRAGRRPGRAPGRRAGPGRRRGLRLGAGGDGHAQQHAAGGAVQPALEIEDPRAAAAEGEGAAEARARRHPRSRGQIAAACVHRRGCSSSCSGRGQAGQQCVDATASLQHRHSPTASRYRVWVVLALQLMFRTCLHSSCRSG
jgi:hypothetical protein